MANMQWQCIVALFPNAFLPEIFEIVQPDVTSFLIGVIGQGTLEMMLKLLMNFMGGRVPMGAAEAENDDDKAATFLKADEEILKRLWVLITRWKVSIS